VECWSCSSLALLYGNVPFKGADMKELHKQILDADYQLKDEISSGKFIQRKELRYALKI